MKMRKIVYHQSKSDFYNFKNFEGVLKYDKTHAIGEALDSELCLYRGTFINGIF